MRNSTDGEERRLLAAGAGAHLEDGVALVGLVLRKQHQLDALLQLRQPALQHGDFRLGEAAHVGIVVAGEHRLEICELALRLPELGDRLHHGRQIAVLLGELAEGGGIGIRLGEGVAQLRVAAHHAVQLPVEG